MFSITKNHIKSSVNFCINLVLLSSFLFSQLSLAEIFLYQNNSDNNPSDIYSNIINIAQAGTSDTWYNSSYSYRKKITIDHTKVPNTNQPNFPMLVSLTDTSLKTVSNGGKVQNTKGYDIIFTNEAGAIKLDHEIEHYDAKTGTIVMWVKIPELSASIIDTVIYIYYGNANITSSEENIAGVWDDGGLNNFKMVQHMNQDPSSQAPQMIDSTQYNNYGTSGGVMTSDDVVAGKVDKAADLDGADDYINISDSDVLTPAHNLTLSSWIKRSTSGSNWQRILGKNYYNYNNDYILESYFDSLRLQIGNGTTNIRYTGPSLVLYCGNEWCLIEVTRDYSNIYFYINGVLRSTIADTLTGNIGNSTNPLRIGMGNEAYYTFAGSIDEVRISSTARSSDWIATEYNNQSSPSTFYTLSSEEEYMNHFIISGSSTQAAGNTQTLVITAIDMFGDNNTAYDGDKDITISGANTIDSNIPTFTDKNGTEIPFNSPGTITFTNGIATTDITLYQAESAEIEASDNTYSTNNNTAYDLNIEVSPNILNNFTINTPISITSETPFNLSLTAKDPYTNTTTNVSNNTILSVNQGTIDISNIPNTQFTDDGTYTTNLTISEIYQDKDIILTITNGSIIKTINLQVTGVSHTSAFIPPSKPNIQNLIITNNNGHIDISNLPDNITHIAISSNPEFTDSSWENITDINNILSKYQSTVYLKFRTHQGATSDTVIYNPISQNTNTLIQEGDIVKTDSSFDVYIIKLKNNQQYKRLILSPNVFNSYRHLKWENIKTIAEEQLNQYQTSNLVKVQNDNNIYRLTPNGDQGTRKIIATYNNGIITLIQDGTQIPDQVWNDNAENNIDIDSVYEINEVDRESYVLE